MKEEQEAIDQIDDLETEAATESDLDFEAEVEPVEANMSILAGVNQDLYDQLTSKNQNFMFNIDKQLNNQLPHSIREQIYHEMVETLIEGQKNSQTARQIYGTPTETIELILEQEYSEPDTDEKSPEWQIALDGGLLLGSIYTIITGLALLNNRAENATTYMGASTLIVNYFAAAIAMLVTSRVMPNIDGPKEERKLGRYFLVSTLAMIGWIFLVTISAVIIPPVLNPIFPNMFYVIFGGITLALRFILKHYLKIKGTVF